MTPRWCGSAKITQRKNRDTVCGCSGNAGERECRVANCIVRDINFNPDIMNTPKSIAHRLSRQMREIVLTMMRKEGRDFTRCQLCPARITGAPDIHHTKYDGATYYDLLLVCRKCNSASENRYLD